MYFYLNSKPQKEDTVSLNFYEKCDDCTSEDRCSLNRLMVEVRDNTLKILENKTLEDFHCGT